MIAILTVIAGLIFYLIWLYCLKFFLRGGRKNKLSVYQRQIDDSDEGRTSDRSEVRETFNFVHPVPGSTLLTLGMHVFFVKCTGVGLTLSLVFQVVVILVICVISLLVVYMGFLLCLDPMMKQPRKDHPYERHQNDEVRFMLALFRLAVGFTFSFPFFFLFCVFWVSTFCCVLFYFISPLLIVLCFVSFCVLCLLASRLFLYCFLFVLCFSFSVPLYVLLYLILILIFAWFS